MKIALKIVGLLIGAWLFVFVCFSQHNEAASQLDTLKKFNRLPIEQTKSVHLVKWWTKPRYEVTLNWPKDKDDIIRFRTAVRDHLYVPLYYIYLPFKRQPETRRIYDPVRVESRSGDTLPLNVWLGDENGVNPGLTVRDRDRGFRDDVDDIFRRKGEPFVPQKTK